MVELPRLKIDELRVRYELEPKLRDVFVEGLFDKELLSEWSFRRSDRRFYYEIDSVDITADLLAKHGLTEGNKQRVIVLARELSKTSEDSNYRCLVDRDLDYWFERLEAVRGLRWTTCTCIETYFLSSECVRMFICVVARSKIVSWKPFYLSFVDVLKYIYSLRLADHELGWNLKWVAFDSCLTLSGDIIYFNKAVYVDKLLQRNSRYRELSSFNHTAGLWARKVRECANAGDCVRGHDFMWLMAWVISKARGMKNYADASTLERALILFCGQVAEFESMLA